MLPQGYSKDKLNAKDKEFVNGMEYLSKEVDKIVLNYDFDDDESIIGKIKKEIIDEFVEHLKTCFGIETDDVIVTMLDNYPDKEE